MANEVYANGRELACKAGSGKTIAAFPDTCFTPPENPATPPGVPVPYPNTGKASDTTKGSKKVMISGKEIMLKDSSYFKTSMGDEAGSAAKKGVVTSKNTGKVYFQAWSMDVKFEGENVDRHLDMTTNNHASFPGDTPGWPYVDAQAIGDGGVCEDMEHLALVPKSPGCPGDQTPHHLIPDRCVQGVTGSIPGNSPITPSRLYNKAPCICVTGTNQHAESHRDCHRIFDPIEGAHFENGIPFEYRKARSAAAESAGGAMNPPRRLSEEERACVEHQLENFYTQPPPDGPGFGDFDHLNATDRSGKVNDFYDTAAQMFA
ncbi:MAG: DUF4150 domain-containing protein [Burkholderiales bacterium]|nr:DUF4150 domain-containing protein [Nitrosomonas sp.]MCP5273330.1 DUF4150 domain-containing protein [Burkholderiales bacterium]